MSEAKLKRCLGVQRLALLTVVCLLVQCTPPTLVRQGPPAPQAPESAQAPTLTPQEQLDLFNTFLDRA